MGYDAIEIRGVEGETRAENIPWFFPERAAETRALVKARGLTITNFGTSCAFHDPMVFPDAVAEGLAAIEVCRRMGIPAIRVFGDQAEAPGAAGRLIAGLRELCAAGKEAGVAVWLENHGTYNTVEVLSPVLDALAGQPGFGVLWDVQHSDRAYGDDYEPFYRLIKPFLRHMHLKDHRRGGEFPHSLREFRSAEPAQITSRPGSPGPLMGEGDIPLERILRRVLADGYDGWFSLEWEKMWHPEIAEPEVAFPQYVEWMREHVD